VIVRDALVGVAPPDSPKLTPHALACWKAAAPGESVGKLQSVRKLDAARVAGTLTKGGGFREPLHFSEPRSASTAERRRIGSFPDAFKFTGHGERDGAHRQQRPPAPHALHRRPRPHADRPLMALTLTPELAATIRGARLVGTPLRACAKAAGVPWMAAPSRR
jgi:site-specific DNA-cytosine methylase